MNNNKRFENHKATLKDLGEVKILNWRNPDSICYSIQYMIRDNHLFVTGDCFNAIYSWSGEVSFEWIAGLSLDYFHSKMNHLDQELTYHWDSDKAVQKLKEYMNNYCEEISEERKIELLQEADEHSSYRSEWAEFIRDNDELYDEDGYLYGAGNEIPLFTKLHLLGLQMAVEQLNKQEASDD